MDSSSTKDVNAHNAAGVLFGAAYYAEYQPYERLDTDLELMMRAGFSVIRVGESVWSTWEPEEGHFDLDWLLPVLDGARAHGIGVVVGTPTYAIPPWLHRKYPEVMAHRSTGTPIPYGHRQNVDFTHPAFRHLAQRLITKIVSRYTDHPAVIGWQVDNEPGAELPHNPAVFAGFVETLRAEYGDVAALNEAWGLTYWSHRIADWAELWTPDGNSTPAYDLAWRRYQAGLTTDFIGWQTELVRSLARPSHFVTTCIDLGRPAIDETALARTLDVTATNIYFSMQDGLAHPAPAEAPASGRPWWLPWSGAWYVYLKADLSYGVRGEPFLVTETHAESIGDARATYPGYDGQWRQAAWALVARGASMVEYWHWHTLHFGRETHWGGVLGHSLEPGRCYAELAGVGAELKQAGPVLTTLQPDADVALLYSVESKWAFEFEPPFAAASSTDPDPRAYDRIFATIHRGLFDARLQAAVVSPQQLGEDPVALAARWPVLIAPALYVAGDDVLALLGEYARHGGHLVLTFRSGYADRDARPRPQVMPGVLRDAVGAHYLEYTNLAGPVPVCGMPGRATAWADALVADSATPIAWYEHPHLHRWPAVTTNRHGDGRVTYVGTLPDATMAQALGQWIAQESLPASPWRSLPDSVTATSARTADGRRLRFVSNWSWEPATLAVPVPSTDLLSTATFEPGMALELGAWDVRVLVESQVDQGSDEPGLERGR
jgi:beta-galactosidase